MIDNVNCFCKNYEDGDGAHENESWTSEYSNILHPTVIEPSFCSYSTLKTVSYVNLDDEDLRAAKLNNIIKKLLDIIRNPVCEDIGFVCYLLLKFLKYNGYDGYKLYNQYENPYKAIQYLEHLLHIRDILDFLSKQAKHIEDYQDFLREFLYLSGKPPLLRKSSELLLCASKLQRHLTLLGYLLSLAPSKDAFFTVKNAIMNFVHGDDKKARKDAVKPSMCREAVNYSKLPFILIEHLAIASDEIYTDILEIILTILPLSQTVSNRLIAAGIEDQLLLKLRLTSCVNETLYNSKYIQKNHIIIPKILWKFMSTLIESENESEYAKYCKSPSLDAMCCLRKILNLSVIEAKRSTRCKTLRNELVRMILANLLGRASGCSEWDFVGSGIADDLAILAVATECGTQNTWAENASIETKNQDDLIFKRTLLIIVTLIVEVQPEIVPLLKERKLIFGLLQFFEPYSEDTKLPWNFEQRWHLFKYVSNALIYLVPKIPEEFIKCNGRQKFYNFGVELVNLKINLTDITYFAEMFCSLSSINCDLLRENLHQFYAKPLFDLIQRVLEFEALSITHQKTISFLLITIQNIVENQCSPLEINELVLKSVFNLLNRCRYQKCEDSKLEQSYLITIGSFIWKCLVPNADRFIQFLQKGGLYLFLDIMENANVCVQNFYLGVLTDICEKQFSIHYLFSWRCADKQKNLISILTHIWKEERKIFGAQKNYKYKDVMESPLINTSQTLYLYYIKSMCNSSNIITIATRPAREKIVFLIKLMQDYEKYQKDCWNMLYNKLTIEERLTFLEIETYDGMKEEEAMMEISKTLDCAKVCPLTKSRENLRPMNMRLYDYNVRLKEGKGKLLDMWVLEKLEEECQEYQNIQNAKLNPAFDALEVFEYIARTSIKDYMLAKKTKQKALIDSSIGMMKNETESLRRTYNSDTNVTAVFNQNLKIRSISKSNLNLEDELSLVSSLTSVVSANASSTCSLTTEKSSAFSFLGKKYVFDTSGNII